MNYPDRVQEQQLDVPRCPINVAARRSGLSAHVIRAWERRYSAIVPGRTNKLRRLYSDWEIQRLVLLRQAVDLGHRIGEIARLPMEELRALVGRETVPGVEASPRIPLPRARLVEVAVDAVRSLEGATFYQALLQATRSLRVPDLLDDFVSPLMADIAHRCRSGDLRVAHERFASCHLRGFLGDLLTSSSVAPSRSTIVVSTLPGDTDEVEALMMAVTASRTGWEPIYPGPGMPVEELVYVAAQRGARAIALGFSTGARNPAQEAQLQQLRSQLKSDLPIFCSGSSLTKAQSGLQQIAAHQPATQRELSLELETLRAAA